MKKTKLITAILLSTILFSAQSSFAQEENNDDSQPAFGMGVSLFNLSNIEYNQNYSPTNSIYFIFNIGNKLRLEPSIGLAFEGDNKQYISGMGLFGKKTVSKFNILYGVRFNMRFNQYKLTTAYNYYGPSQSKTITDKSYEISPTIGGEYSFIKNFSLGAEVKYSSFKSGSDWVSYTNSSVLIRFYF